MLLIQFGDGIGHFRLYPDTESDAVSVSGIHEALYAVGKFVLVHHPVAQRTAVVKAGILVAEPAVVHHEELAAHRSDVGHHLVHAGFVDVEIDSFPTVQQDLALPVAVGDLMRTGPAMEVARGPAETFVGICQGKFRSAERLARSERKRAVVGADTGEDAVIIGIVGDYVDMVIATVAERCTNHRACILGRLAVQGEHYLRVGSVRIAHAVLVLDAQHSSLEGFFHQPAFIGPGAIEMAHPDIAGTDGQECRVELAQQDGLLLPVDDLRPGLDHIHVVEGLVIQFHTEIIGFVLESDAGYIPILRRRCGYTLDDKVEGHVTVSVRDFNRVLADLSLAIRGIRVQGTDPGETEGVGIGYLRSEVQESGSLALAGAEDK